MNKNKAISLEKAIGQELLMVILKETDFPRDIIITISEVRINLSTDIATVFLMIFPDSKKLVAAKELNLSSAFIRRKLGKRIKTKVIPRIVFKVVDTKTAT